MNSSTEQIASELIIAKASPPHPEFLKETKLFHNKEIALQLEFPQKTIAREKIINLINLVHFLNEKLLLHICDPRKNTEYLAEAFPDPAVSDEITCRLPFPSPSSELKDYEIRHIVIRKDNSMIAVPAVLKKVNADFISISLREDGIPLGRRKMQRFYCSDIAVEMKQGGHVLRGELKDFNADSFRVKVSSYSRADASINLDAEAQLTIQRNSVVYFSGICRPERIYLTHGEWGIVFRQIPGDPSKAGARFRNPRLKLAPQPVAVIRHPFLNDKYEREIADLSNNGLLIRERAEESILMPGIIIPELVIRYAGALEIVCQARVLYRREDGDSFLYGTAILDMNIQNHTSLTNLIFNHVNPNTFISKNTNMDALWEFFFDTGFIYPKKYHLIGAAREEFKATYKRLYEECPEIARHFTFERNGKIYGHISMIKAYSRTWLFHHLAARSMEGKIVGLEPLKQVVHFLDGFEELPSVRSDYVLAFYQPQNRFASRAYGGFTRAMQNLKASSQDLFSYMTCPVEARQKLPQDHSLEESSAADLSRLDQFYKDRSGGLLLEAMGINQRNMIDNTLKSLYSRSGFKRSCRIYSLKLKESILAVLIHEESDPGLNLSEMLNCIKIFVVNADLEWEVISKSVSQLVDGNTCPEVALFVYPEEMARIAQLKSKQYQFWILNLKDHDYDYKEYMAKNFRIRF